MNSAIMKQLKAIGSRPVGKFFALPKDMKAAYDEGLVTGNIDLKDPKDPKKIAWKLTDKGVAAIPASGTVTAPKAPVKKTPAKKSAAKKSATKKTTTETVAAPAATPLSFAIAEFDIPPVMRNSKGSKYPFASLEPGTAFFVPEGGEVKDPSKSFGSMVTSANKKYRNPTDFRKFTARTIVLDQKNAKLFGHPVGTRGVAVARLKPDAEAKAKATAFPRSK